MFWIAKAIISCQCCICGEIILPGEGRGCMSFRRKNGYKVITKNICAKCLKEIKESETTIDYEKMTEIVCPNCKTKDVELEQCEFCLNWFCCECIDEHKLNCPEREVL